jgi:phage gp45-like
MDLFEHVARLRADLREFARQLVANAIQFTQLTRSTSSGEHDKVAGYRTEGVGETAYDYEVRRLQHFGFRSRPPKDVWVLRVAATGGATNNATVAEDSTRYGPSDLGDGEVALYNSVRGLEVRFDSDGNIKLQSASGKLVSLQGGDRGVAREQDSVDCGTLIFVPGPSAALSYVQPGGQMPPIPQGATTIALKGVISSASDKTKTG